MPNDQDDIFDVSDNAGSTPRKKATRKKSRRKTKKPPAAEKAPPVEETVEEPEAAQEQPEAPQEAPQEPVAEATQEEPAGDEAFETDAVFDEDEMTLDDEIDTEENATRVAEDNNLDVLSEQDRQALTDTMPTAENEVTRAKRENPHVARWDAFLTGLTQGTLELIYEMGISGLETGDQPITNLRRSDLVKPKGLMLEQHADAVEGGLAALGLTLMPELPPNVIGIGDKLPNNVIPRETQRLREARRRNLRTTM